MKSNCSAHATNPPCHFSQLKRIDYFAFNTRSGNTDVYQWPLPILKFFLLYFFTWCYFIYSLMDASKWKMKITTRVFRIPKLYKVLKHHSTFLFLFYFWFFKKLNLKNSMLLFINPPKIIVVLFPIHHKYNDKKTFFQRGGSWPVCNDCSTTGNKSFIKFEFTSISGKSW